MRPTEAGTVAIRSYTRTDATSEAIDMAANLLGRCTTPAIDAGHARVRPELLAGSVPALAGNGGQLPTQFAELEFYGLDREYVDAYAEELAAVSGHVSPVIDAVFPKDDQVVMVVIGQAEKLREGLRKYGPLTEMKLSDPVFEPARQTEEPRDLTSCALALCRPLASRKDVRAASTRGRKKREF